MQLHDLARQGQADTQAPAPSCEGAYQNQKPWLSLHVY